MIECVKGLYDSIVAGTEIECVMGFCAVLWLDST